MKRRLFTRLSYPMIGVIVFAMLLWSSGLIYQQYQGIRSLTDESVNDVLDVVEHQVGHFIEHPEMELMDYSMRITDDEDQLVLGVSDRLSPLSKYIYRTEVIDSDGMVVAGAPFTLERVGFDLKRHEIYRDLTRTDDELILGNVMIDPMTGDPSIFIGSRHEDNYIVGYVGLDLFQVALKDLEIEDNIITIVDSDGKYLMHPRDELVNQRTVDPNFKDLLSEKIENGNSVTYYKRDYALYARHLPLYDYHIIYYVDTRSVYETLTVSVMFSLIALLIITILIIACSMRHNRDADKVLSVVHEASNALVSGSEFEGYEDSEDEKLAEILTNMKLTSQKILTMEREHETNYTNLEESRFKSLSSLANLIESFDGLELDHCNKVCEYALMLGEYYHLSEEDLLQLKYGAMLHDIGKITLPEHVVKKVGPFNQEERKLMEHHTINGFEALKDIPLLEGARGIILYHHERYDGQGYPFNKKEEDIPLLARMVAIADAFDAMTSKRLYRNRIWSNAEAYNELVRCKNKQFDGRLVDMFIKAMQLSTEKSRRSND